VALARNDAALALANNAVRQAMSQAAFNARNEASANVSTNAVATK
jgi:hypothetical protein